MYKKYLNNAKDCGAVSSCFEQGNYKRLNGGSSSNWETREDMAKMLLSDGVQLYFHKQSNTCSSNNFYQDGSNDVCSLIYVDLNGKKSPNTIGRDVFAFALKEDSLYPCGCDVESLCDSKHYDYACACKVLREGAMNY